MTATASAVPIWKHYGPKGLIFPSVVLLVLGVFAIGKLIQAPDTATLAAVTADAAQQGAERAAQQTPATEPAPPATVPGYDYLSCSHVQAGDPAPCSPVLVWPITAGAQTLIGYQRGGIPGELSTANTREVYQQIRNRLVGVDACQMWLGLERDTAMNPILTVYPSQSKAPAGSVRLVDCAPTVATPGGTIPTAGQS